MMSSFAESYKESTDAFLALARSLSEAELDVADIEDGLRAKSFTM